MPIVGTCGNCGGPVQTPDMWGGVIPPTPTCMRCGATAATPYGPVMPMTPRRDDIEILEAAIRQAAKLTPNAGNNPPQVGLDCPVIGLEKHDAKQVIQHAHATNKSSQRHQGT